MHIRRLVIQGFRNFGLLDVAVTQGVTCIVGENNSGKSNLIEALRLAVDANLTSSKRQLEPEDFPVGTDFSVPIQVLVSVEFTGFAAKPAEEAMVFGFNVEDDVARITYRFRPKQELRQMIKDGSHPGTGLTLEDYRWELRGGGPIDPAAAKWDEDFGKSVRFEELQQSYLVVFMEALRDVDVRLRQSRSSPLGRLLTTADVPTAEQKALVQVLQRANVDITGSPTVKGLGKDLSDAFANAAGAAYKMGVTLGMTPPTFNDISKSLNVLLSTGALDGLSTSRNGLGLNNVLYISMLLHYFQRRVKEGKTAGQLLIVEEPEAHLHPQLQRVLLKALQAGGFQSVLTTHSTHVTSATSLSSLVVLTNDGSPKTSSCVPSARTGATSEEIADLERYLDATRGTLLYARRVMLVEGPAELFLIPALVRSVMKINLDEVGISVLPIFGVHFSAYTRLFGKTGIAKKCAVVADADLTPSDATPTEEGEDKPPAKPQLFALRNSHVEIFLGATTFEFELATAGTLRMIAAAARELGATKTLTHFESLMKLPEFGPKWFKEHPEELNKVRALTLSMAKNYGKARFAQIASKHADKATDIPQYIAAGVEWLLK